MIEGFRLSPAQRRLWLLGAQSYRSRCVVSLTGELNEAALGAVLQQIVERHEILRTSFQLPQGMKTPLQVVATSGAPDWQKLLAVAPQQWRLAVDLPAMCADARSLKNLANELAAGLRGEALNGEVMQYADLAEWQHELLAAEEAETGRQYWRAAARKQNLPELLRLRLPFTAQHSTAASFAPQPFSLELPAATVARAAAVAAQYGVAPEAFWLACWQTLLWRLTGQTATVTGVAFNGRRYAELETALGLFTKYLPLVAQPEQESSFSQLLQQTAAALRGAAPQQDFFSWELLKGAETAFFPYCFAYEELPEARQAGAVVITMEELAACCDRFEVQLSCLRKQGRLLAEFQYDAQRQRASDIARLAAQFAAVVESAVAEPEMQLSRLNILSASERQQVLSEFNQTAHAYPQDKCVHELFEAQAAHTPEAPAIVFEERQLSYGALNQRANQLAQRLIECGVQPDAPVALLLERGPEMIVALLGVWKAGGAYLPLEAGLPAERLAALLADSQAAVLVTQTSLAARLPNYDGRVVQLDAELEATAPSENPARRAQPENLAYVIYTSGSTGQPKGVAVEHRNLVNYVYGVSERLQLPPGASYATVTTFAADLGHTALFPALCSGGCVHVIAQERAADSAALAAYFRRQPVDCLKIVPSHLAALLAGAEAADILPRQRLVLGGEAASWELLEKVRALNPACLIFNHYGPTETTVGALCGQIENDGCTATAPLGRPLANTQIYLLDAHKQPVSIGVAGELYIGGAGVARGYLHQPQLTAAKFILRQGNEDKGIISARQTNYSSALIPLSEAGGRWYRTGDLARWLPDGRVEFLGRVDDQVKIRGFRIEPGEVAAVLLKHSGVRECFVMAREDKPGEKYLTAYVVAADSANSDKLAFVGLLREFLREKLPDYMIPAAFVLLESLPLTRNGKVDRRALSAPERGLAESFVAPQTPLEETIAGIWAAVLKQERVGRCANFFELGGHSLLIAQIVARVRKVCQVELPLRALFEQPTVAGLAALVEQTRTQVQVEAAPPLQPVARDGSLPLSFGQRRLWFVDQLEPGNPFYNVPRAFRLRGAPDAAALRQALNALLARHESLRTTFSVANAEPVQVIAPLLELNLPVIELSHFPTTEREAEARRLAETEARRPFDLAHGPLVRAVLLRLSAQEHVLLLTMHHVVSDGWSAGVLFHELSALYANSAASLPVLPIQYADYAVWQRTYLQGERLANLLAYWRKQLAGAPPLLELPTERPRPAIASSKGAYHTRPLPANLAQSLAALSRQEGVTLFMTLLAAFQTLLHRYTKQTDIVVGTDVAGRDRAELEGLLGFFMNHLVLRTDLAGNPTFRTLLMRVRETALGAYAHQDLPFDLLVEELNPQRSLSHTPLFQVLFVLNAPTTPLQLTGLQTSPFSFDSGQTKFDLALFIEERQTELLGQWVYRTDLFDARTLERFAAQFSTLLTGIAAQPDTRLNAFTLLTEAEQQQQLQEKNERRAANLKKLAAVQPQAISISQE